MLPMTAPEVSTSPAIPGVFTGPVPLENGDRLTRCEFERRYLARPDIRKAELVEGVVYMPSPVRAESHAKPTAALIMWLNVYCASTPRVSALADATVRLDRDNEPQPDALLRIDAEAGGQSRVNADDYVEGPPELIVEMAASSVSRDLHDKLNAYRRSGVLEYVVWRVHDRAVDWFVLIEDEYRPQPPDAGGLLTSRVFPGLRLDVSALLDGDLAAVLATLQNGLNTREQAAFVARSQRRTFGT